LNKIKCRTLFATHYHELAALDHPRLVNRSLLVEEAGSEIIFRRRLIEGAAEESYGIHVARLAGVPAEVLQRAEDIMLELKSGEKLSTERMPVLASAKQKKVSKKRAEEAIPMPDLFTLI
jgi:DNA mismatch repair protein MutS